MKRVDDLREVWPHEAHSFTKWLAQEENLALLGEETGLSFSGVQTEAPVGRFNVDILAEEEETGQKIIIENQLEDNNHDHLGKLVTYAAGLDAKVVIWIFKEIREEHRRAIDWLNEHTVPEVRLFAVKMELWQIDNSALAPKFHVISAPNDWGKSVRGGLTQRRQDQLQFWDTFRDFCQKHNSAFSFRKPSPAKWYSLDSLGTMAAQYRRKLQAGFLDVPERL